MGRKVIVEVGSGGLTITIYAGPYTGSDLRATGMAIADLRMAISELEKSIIQDPNSPSNVKVVS